MEDLTSVMELDVGGETLVIGLNSTFDPFDCGNMTDNYNKVRQTFLVKSTIFFFTKTCMSRNVDSDHQHH